MRRSIFALCTQTYTRAVGAAALSTNMIPRSGIRFRLALSACAIVAGCSLGPDYKRPDAAMPAAWLGAADPAAASWPLVRLVARVRFGRARRPHRTGAPDQQRSRRRACPGARSRRARRGRRSRAAADHRRRCVRDQGARAVDERHLCRLQAVCAAAHRELRSRFLGPQPRRAGCRLGFGASEPLRPGHGRADRDDGRGAELFPEPRAARPPRRCAGQPAQRRNHPQGPAPAAVRGNSDRAGRCAAGNHRFDAERGDPRRCASNCASPSTRLRS